MKRVTIYEDIKAVRATEISVPDDWDKNKIIEYYLSDEYDPFESNVDSTILCESIESIGNYIVEL